MKTLKGWLETGMLALLGSGVIVVSALIAVVYLFLVGGGYVFTKGLPNLLRKTAVAISWFLKRFADAPFVAVMIIFVYLVRFLIARYDPEAALSFLDVWDRISQAGLLTALFSLAFFGFLYFNFRAIFTYIYPDKSKKTYEHTLQTDFQHIQPWQRLLSIPLLFLLLLLVFRLSLRVMQAIQ